MKCQTLFSGEIKKSIRYMFSADFVRNLILKAPITIPDDIQVLCPLKNNEKF